MPNQARNIPVVGGIYGFVQEQIGFDSSVSNYTCNYNEPVTSNGISITVSEIYCDGLTAYISYILEGEEISNLYKTNCYYDEGIALESKYTVDGSTEASQFGYGGIEGEWVNDGETYVGFDRIELRGEDNLIKFPEKFILNINISSLEIMGNTKGVSNAGFKGDWSFDLEVNCDHDNVYEIDISKSNNEHSIDRIVVSPVMITLFTSYPDIYYSREFWEYDVVIYSDLSPDEPIGSWGICYHTHKYGKIPRYLADKELDIYIVDLSTFTDEDRTYERKVFERKAIVSAHIEL